MKMDEEYFKKKYIQIANSMAGTYLVPVLTILRQIAHDTAMEQRINCSAACALRMKGRVDANCKCGEIYCAAKLEIPHD